MPRRVLLDTNALLMPFQVRLNLGAELRRILGDPELVVPSPVLAELRVLAAQDRDAKPAMKLATSCTIVEAIGPADDALVDLAKEWGAPVVTNDQALLERLRQAGVPRIFLRSRNHLVAEGL